MGWRVSGATKTSRSSHFCKCYILTTYEVELLALV